MTIRSREFDDLTFRIGPKPGTDLARNIVYYSREPPFPRSSHANSIESPASVTAVSKVVGPAGSPFRTGQSARW
jgi:hypothetical protein